MNTKELIQKYIDDMEKGKILTVTRKPFKYCTRKTYKHALNMYLEFGVFEITQFKPGLNDSARRAIANKFIKHMEAFEESMYVGVNSKATIMNIVSIVVNHIAGQLMIAIPRISKPKALLNPIMTLPDAFVKRFLTDEEKYNSLSKRHKLVWEVCAIMLVSSLRIKDACSLTDLNFDHNSDGLFMIKENSKTGKITTSPLPTLLSKILLNNINNGSLYTKSGIQMLPCSIRREFKNFFKQYEDTDVDVVVRKYNMKGVLVSKTDKLYNVILPHMFRKTSITMMLANGVSIDHAKFASGHSQGSKSFDRYVAFSDQRYSSEIKRYYNSIL